jgi:hypothetical protein
MSSTNTLRLPISTFAGVGVTALVSGMLRRLALVLAAIACATVAGACGSPASPTPNVPSALAVTAATPTADLAATAPTTQLQATVTCKPTFTRSAIEDDFFILTIAFPSGCQWFAQDVETNVNYWELTAPEYALRNRQKYLQGYSGVGKQKVGVHFLRKIGWNDHRTFVLQVCSGSSCSGGPARWTYKTTI